MKIVIDIDNTIVDYRRSLFSRLKQSNINLNGLCQLNKMSSIKKTIKNKYGDKSWQTIQGYIYSDESNEVNFYENCSDFIRNAFQAKFDIYFVSHKTKFGLNIAKNIDIRKIAQNRIKSWLIKEKIEEFVKEIIFTDTFEEKILYIQKIDPLIIIDDLIEIHKRTIDNRKDDNKYINILFEGNKYGKSIKKSRNIFRANNWIEIEELLLN